MGNAARSPVPSDAAGPRAAKHASLAFRAARAVAEREARAASEAISDQDSAAAALAARIGVLEAAEAAHESAVAAHKSATASAVEHREGSTGELARLRARNAALEADADVARGRLRECRDAKDAAEAELKDAVSALENEAFWQTELQARLDDTLAQHTSRESDYRDTTLELKAKVHHLVTNLEATQAALRKRNASVWVKYNACAGDADGRASPTTLAPIDDPSAEVFVDIEVHDAADIDDDETVELGHHEPAAKSAAWADV